MCLYLYEVYTESLEPLLEGHSLLGLRGDWVVEYSLDYKWLGLKYKL